MVTHYIAGNDEQTRLNRVCRFGFFDIFITSKEQAVQDLIYNVMLYVILKKNNAIKCQK